MMRGQHVLAGYRESGALTKHSAIQDRSTCRRACLAVYCSPARWFDSTAPPSFKFARKQE